MTLDAIVFTVLQHPKLQFNHKHIIYCSSIQSCYDCPIYEGSGCAYKEYPIDTLRKNVPLLITSYRQSNPELFI